MSEHPNVAVVNRMTQAILDGDRQTLATCFTEDAPIHIRGPFPKAGDHVGAEGFVTAVGNIVEETEGDVKLDQQFCVGTEGWVSEFEHCTLGRKGRTLEMENSFVYRFENGRIAELWMISAAEPGSEAFFQ